MQFDRYKPILRALGIAFVAAGGFLIIGGMDFIRGLLSAATAHKLALSLELKPAWFLLIAIGVLLPLDLARSASIIRWVAILLASAFACYLLLTPVYMPLGYLLAQLWLTPAAFLQGALWTAPVFLVLFAIIIALSRPRVVAACAARGVTMRSALVPMICGALLAVPFVYAMTTILDTAFVQRAKALAFEKAGPDHGYFVSSYGHTITTTQKPGQPIETTTIRRATVMAYNFREIRPVEVEWTEE